MIQSLRYKLGLSLAFLIVGWADVAFSSRYIFDSSVRTINYFLAFPTTNIVTRWALVCGAIVIILATFPGAWLLSLATAWGLKRNRRWAKGTGIAACMCLLPSFPWLTLVGVAGLVAILLIEKPPPAPTGLETKPDLLPDNYWAIKRESFAQVALAFLTMITLLVGAPQTGWAALGGVPEWKWFLCSIVLFLVNVLVHEAGHVSLALLLRHQVHVVSVGPWTISREPTGIKAKFELKKLVAFGGYVGAVPTDCEHLRLKQIAIIAAGPVASALCCGCFVAARAFVWASHFQYVLFFSWGAVVSLLCFIVSAMPVGYSDGNMLLHLACKTRAGDLLLRQLRTAHEQLQAEPAMAKS